MVWPTLGSRTAKEQEQEQSNAGQGQGFPFEAIDRSLAPIDRLEGVRRDGFIDCLAVWLRWIVASVVQPLH